jgi:hypothetical protein
VELGRISTQSPRLSKEPNPTLCHLVCYDVFFVSLISKFHDGRQSPRAQSENVSEKGRGEALLEDRVAGCWHKSSEKFGNEDCRN